jgi:hypothetical protein
MIQGKGRMPPRLADKIKRLQLIVPEEWITQVEAWRRHQPDPMPSTSECIRRLVEMGLKANGDKPKPKKIAPKPKG